MNGGSLDRLAPMHDCEQCFRSNRLRNVLSEAAIPACRMKWVSAHCDEVAASELRIGLEGSGNIVPIDAREEDVTDDDFWKEAAGDFEARDALVSHFDPMASSTQARRQTIHGIRVIVDHENAAGTWCGRFARRTSHNLPV